MDTVFDRLETAGKTWGIYYHDFPQTLTLGHLWFHPFKFHHFDEFLSAANAGTLPAYTFIEPQYFADVVGITLPNDEHPPHNVAYGEQLIAAVYNAVRAGPNWKKTLLIITYDEHGGCFDHVIPPAAVEPGGPTPDGFAFDSFGVRVPAVIVSPFVEAGKIVRPLGDTPFDHTSIFKTLQDLFGLQSLTPRSDAAPSLLPVLMVSPDNDGPTSFISAAVAATAATVATAAARRPNNMQQSLSQAAVKIPTADSDVAAHIERILAAPDPIAEHAIVGTAALSVAAHMKAFVGEK
jgi:phospholipase C